MKLLFALLAAALSFTPVLSKPKSAVHGYPINPVPFTSVKVTSGTSRLAIGLTLMGIWTREVLALHTSILANTRYRREKHAVSLC